MCTAGNYYSGLENHLSFRDACPIHELSGGVGGGVGGWENGCSSIVSRVL